MAKLLVRNKPFVRTLGWGTIAFILVLSCKNNSPNDLRGLISGENFKVWDVIYDEGADLIYKNKPKPYLEGYIFFAKNDSLAHFEYRDNRMRKISPPPSDVIVKKKWRILNDSVMEFMGGLVKITKITEDTLVLIGSTGRLELIKSDNQTF